MRISIDWDVSPFFGWGVYGLNLALECAQRNDVELYSTGCVNLATVDPLRRRALEQFQLRSGLRPAAEVELIALGNELAGRRDVAGHVGVVFFEDPLSALGEARARDAKLLVAGSSWNHDILAAVGAEVCTILQGVDHSVFHPAQRRGLFKDRFVIFSGGKAEPRKGQDLVVQAFRIFARRHPEAVLVTAWSSPWPQLAAGMDLDLREFAGRVIDVGARTNEAMASIIRECDVALFPNRCEGGTNLVAMECMACGIPTILSANSGHLHLMSLGDTVPLLRQQPRPGRPLWHDSSVDEILARLERIFDIGPDPFLSSSIPNLNWRNTTHQLLEAIGELGNREDRPHG